MKYYVIAEMQVTDPGWVTAYVENVTRLIEQRGGRYLARTSTIEKLEGERARPQVIVITEWPERRRWRSTRARSTSRTATAVWPDPSARLCW